MQKRGFVFLAFLLAVSVVLAGRPFNCSLDNCTDLYAWYKMDDTSGPAVDSAGFDQNGTIVGVTRGVGGVHGSAYSFDGIDDLVDDLGSASDFTFLQNTGVFSMFVWSKLDDFSADRAMPYMTSAFGSNEKGFYFEYDNRSGVGTNVLRMLLGKGVGGDQVIAGQTATGVVLDNEWHHVGMVGNGTHVVFFVDGIADSTIVGPMDVVKSTGDATRPVEIGRLATLYYDGLMDEYVVFNRTVLAPEVLFIFNSQAAPTGEGTVFSVSAGSTNFTSVSNLRNVSGMVLANSNSRISWNGAVDAVLEDYANNVLLGDGFVAVNSSNLDTSINSSANVSVRVPGCSGDWQIYSSPEFVFSKAELISTGVVVGTGNGGAGSCTSVCSNPVCQDGVITFTVSGFSSHGASGGAVPEFGQLALMILVGISMTGYFMMRRRE